MILCVSGENHILKVPQIVKVFSHINVLKVLVTQFIIGMFITFMF